MGIYEKLIPLADLKYKDFQAKLVPNIASDKILGVRSPDLRKLAKELKDTKEGLNFLNELPHEYYEENLVHFFMISFIKDFDTCIKEINRFLPYVDCWPVSDQSSPKVFTKNHDKLLLYIKEWISSSHVYTARFGIRILMNEFLGDDFKEEYLNIVANKKGEDYYLKMMVAWYFATSLAKQYEKTIPYFEKHILEDWVHNKAIQKALESFRVSKDHKEYLKTLR